MKKLILIALFLSSGFSFSAELNQKQQKTNLTRILAKFLNFYSPKAATDCLTACILGPQIPASTNEEGDLRSFTIQTGNAPIVVQISHESSVESLRKAVAKKAGKSVDDTFLNQEGLSLDLESSVKVIDDEENIFVSFLPKEIFYKIKDEVFEFVRIDKKNEPSFYIGKYQVTQAQWVAIMKYNPSHFQGPNYPNYENHPVECVSYRKIVSDFIPRLHKAGLRKARLPRIEEWEYAAGVRDVEITALFNGNYEQSSKLKKQAWILANSQNTTHAVGRKEPNHFGLYDMFGNVWEWVLTPQDDEYSAFAKGYSWSDLYVYMKPRGVNNQYPNSFQSTLGFRLVVAVS